MKKVLFFILCALFITFTGCSKKTEDDKQGKSASYTTNALIVRNLLAAGNFDFPSTTTITPPGVNNPTDATLVHLEGHPVLVFFEGTGQIYSPFVAGVTPSTPRQVGPWLVTQFAPNDANPRDIQIYVNHDNQANSHYKSPHTQIPLALTKNLYMASYTGFIDNDGRIYDKDNASLIIGDAAIFAPDPPDIPAKLKDLVKKQKEVEKK